MKLIFSFNTRGINKNSIFSETTKSEKEDTFFCVILKIQYVCFEKKIYV